MTASSLVADIVEELRSYAPFDAMSATALDYMARHLVLRYYAKGAEVVSPADGVVTGLYIVQKGEVTAVDARDATAWYGPGECFPVGALIAARPASRTLVAANDTFCYHLSDEHFQHVMDTSPEFRHFATRRMAALLAQSQQQAQSRFTASVGEALRLASPLKSIIRRTLVTISPTSPIRTALESMRAERIGSVVIIDQNQAPLGIFTERDVLNRIVLGGIDEDRPISEAMTAHPFVLPSHASLIEAAHAMARHRFRHVLVMEEGKLIGVVSERDLFAVQLLSLGEIVTRIDVATNAAALASAADEVQSFSGKLLAQGVAAGQLTQFVTTLNDAVVARALALAAQYAPPPNADWCWIGLGSEGRMEQTLSTDQDNALIFRAQNKGEAETLRPAFLAFATATNGILDQCGFPLCKGEIMAKNPKWCLSESEWQAMFTAWLRLPEPEALLNAAIFFDFRALAGDTRLAEALRRWLTDAIPRYSLFLRQMTENALIVRPPLGIFRDFVTDDENNPGTIDLKKYCVRPFVDAARLLALRVGVEATNTADRLRLVAPKIRLRDDEVGAIVDSFHFVQLLRLRHQQSSRGRSEAAENGERHANPNRIFPDELNLLDRRILKEALTHARQLQNRIAMDFPT